MDDIIIVVPTYKPEFEISYRFLTELKAKFNNIIVVNDGSGLKYDDFFNKIEMEGFTVLKHCINMGKGRALKTAFNYVCNNYPNFKGIVTADCDGQHSVTDIKKCAEAVKKDPDSLILGVRDFNQKNVPFKSRYGNKITRFVFKNFIGLKISDTQTGLRGLSKELVERFVVTKGERYEYETNMLIDSVYHDVDIKEVKISTIYINKNEASHFNPIKDSLSIYKLFAKYVLASFSSFILDIVLFAILVSLMKGNVNYYILVATIIARDAAILYNYIIGGNLILKKASIKYLTRYMIILVIQVLVSGFAITYLSGAMPDASIVLIKVITDILISVVCLFI